MSNLSTSARRCSIGCWIGGYRAVEGIGWLNLDSRVRCGGGSVRGLSVEGLITLSCCFNI